MKKLLYNPLVHKTRNLLMSTMLCIAFLMPTFAFAQTNTVTGTVIDDLGDPLIGVTIMIKDATVGAKTDLDGNFTIQAAPHNVLRFSYIGFATQEITVGNQANIRVTMKEDSKALSEVVVVGYGTMEKRAVTSSITSVKGDQLIQGVGGSSIATALQGRIPGLNIAGTSSPNSSNSFQLRGIASINAGKGPLIVIDGIPGGDIRALSQEDIESIDVLKDASAGAIYGTRAAGGVILITTKNGKNLQNGVKIKYTGEVSFETVRKKPDIMNSNDYIIYGLGDDYGYDTDWYSELVRDSPVSHNHVINIAGGSENTHIYTTIKAGDQKGIVIGDGRTDFSGRINAGFKFWDGKASITTNTEYREAKRDRRNSEGTFNMAMALNPTIPLRDPSNPIDYLVNGYGISGTDFNPVADVNLRSYDAKDTWLLADAALQVSITDNLNVKGVVGYQKSQLQQNSYVSRKHSESIRNNRQGSAQHKFDKTETISLEAYATYDKTFAEEHKVNVVGGYSFWEYNREFFNMTNYDFPVESVGPWDMRSGLYLSEGRADMVSGKSPRERLLSVFGRANYSFRDRYMLTASVRHEGSSKFGKNHRWGTFWALSGGWILTEEHFMKNIEALSMLKFRLGYGVTGNNDFSNSNTVRQYKSDGVFIDPTGQWNTVYGSARNVNPDLKWEEKTEVNFGFDFGFFNDRLYGKFDIYKRKVNDLLYDIKAPQPPMIQATVLSNAGSLENFGFEFELGADIVKTSSFTYNSNIRLSKFSSKIDDIGETVLNRQNFPSPGNPGYGVQLRSGSKIGQFFLYKHAGVTEDGKWLIYDKDDNIVPAKGNLKDDNKRVMGNSTPSAIVSWDHNFTYKNWDMSILLRSWINFDVFSQPNLYYGMKNSQQTNVLKKQYLKNQHINDMKILNDYWLDDGTFLKLDAITIGYTLNLKKYTKNMSSVRFYATGRDLFMFTGYKGITPEVDINGLDGGFELIKNTNSMYPQTRRFAFGAQVTF